MATDFETFATGKEQAARHARVDVLVTEEDRSADRPLLAIGNEWSERHYDGSFHMFPVPPVMPAVSLVFVQSKDGDTVARNPAELGGGDTDLHLLYEGLSRVAVDGVLAGAATARGRMFFSVWHPELVALRLALGMPRHPAQIVVSNDGNLNIESDLIFNVPEVPVFLIAGPTCREHCGEALARRTWVSVIPMERDRNLLPAFHELRQQGIHRISAVGGRRTASSLIDAGLVQDLCLTTTSKTAGEPGTPLYGGDRTLQLDTIIRKRWPAANGAGNRFEHLAVRTR